MSNEEYEKNYVGSIINNESYLVLHGKAEGKKHFEQFKHALKRKGFEYEQFTKSRAQILKVNNQGKELFVYFTGGTTWWGFQKSAIKNMKDESKKESVKCYLLIFADVKDRHYWLMPVDDDSAKKLVKSDNNRKDEDNSENNGEKNDESKNICNVSNDTNGNDSSNENKKSDEKKITGRWLFSEVSENKLTVPLEIKESINSKFLNEEDLMKELK